MNERFNQALLESGKSAYELSKESGVPYTTISELRNQKSSINRCPAEKVFRLAVALGQKPGDLLDEISYLDGVKGRYGTIPYRWVKRKDESTLRLEFNYRGETVLLDTEHFYNNPERLWAYRIIAGWRIQEYLDEEAWKEHAGRIRDAIQRKARDQS